jgi:hypothetical protein
MTIQEMQDALTDLKEIRAEISNVNRNAGRTIFNPAATDALNALIAEMDERISEAA